MRKFLTKIFWNIEVWAVQKHVNLVDLVKSFPKNIFLQILASIQQRTSLIKFDIWLKNQSKIRYRTFQLSPGPRRQQVDVAARRGRDVREGRGGQFDGRDVVVEP